ncbi:MAG: hypothetical protein V2A76_03955 [Planctomycetota bacterium]
MRKADMRRTLKNLALTVAGCGSLAAPAFTHEVCAPVAEVVGEAAPSADSVRAALCEDAGFDRLFERIRREALPSSNLARHGEDSLQEALLKIWQGRPELFLMGPDELVRYLRTATRRNAITLAAKDRTEALEPSEVAATRSGGPAREAEALDLLEELSARLEPPEQETLQCLLRGIHTPRDLAKELGRTRYATAQSLDQIERELDRLMRPAGA